MKHKINNESAEPLFIQVKKFILKELQSRNLKLGEKIPSENQFCQASETSIRTVRRALGELEKDGVIFRRQGRGSFLKDLKLASHTGTLKRIGIFFCDLEFLLRPSFSLMIKGMEQAAPEFDYALNLFAVGRRFDNTASLSRLANLVPLNEISGAILISPMKKDDIIELRERSLPIVTMHNYKSIHTDVASGDFVAAADIGLNYLSKNGHRRIGIIGGFEGNRNEAVILRNALFLERCHEIISEKKLDIPCELIRFSDYSQQDGYRIASEMLKLPNRPTAIFTVDDLLAQGVVEAVRDSGLNIPNNVAVLSCNDSTQNSFISSIRMPLLDIGKAAVSLLNKRIISGNSIKREKIIFQPELIIRQST